jgi:hypothetical protein
MKLPLCSVEALRLEDHHLSEDRSLVAIVAGMIIGKLKQKNGWGICTIKSLGVYRAKQTFQDRPYAREIRVIS